MNIMDEWNALELEVVIGIDLASENFIESACLFVFASVDELHTDIVLSFEGIWLADFLVLGNILLQLNDHILELS